MKARKRKGTCCFAAALFTGVAAMQAGSAQAAITDNLQLYTTLNAANISGTTVFDSANAVGQGGAQNGTIQVVSGSTPTQTTGLITGGGANGALDFTGNNAQVGVTFGNVLSPGTGSYTVSLWFNSDTFNTTRVYASKGNEGSNGLGWLMGTVGTAGAGTLFFRAGDGTNAFNQSIDVGTAGLTTGTWHLATLVIDRTANKIFGYIDGSNAGMVGTNTIGGAVNFNNTDALVLGRRSAINSNYDGRLDDVAIWNRALTQLEISTLAAAGFQGGSNARGVTAAQTGALGGTFVGTVASADAYLDTNAPTTAHDAGLADTTTHTAGGVTGGKLLISAAATPMLKFDLSQITALATAGFHIEVIANSAKLVLNQTDTAGSLNATNIAGHAITSAWSESTVTANTAPSFNGANLFTAASLTNGNNVFASTAFDAIVQTWLNDPTQNFGLLLKALGGEDAFLARTQANAPRLEFEYNIVANVVIPEPASLSLAALGLLALAPRRSRR